MRISKLFLSITLFCFLSLRAVNCFADVSSSTIVEIEYEEEIYYAELFDLIEVWKLISSTDTSEYSTSRITQIENLFSKKDLSQYGNGIKIYKDIVRIPLHKLWPDYYNSPVTFPIEYAPDFPLENLAHSKILKAFHGSSAEVGYTSPLTKNDEYWMVDYPLEIIHDIKGEIDYVFFGIKGCLTTTELVALRNQIKSIQKETTDQRKFMQELASKIYNKHIIVLEYWHY